MRTRSIPGWLQGALEYGPVIGFLGVYLAYRDTTFSFAGTAYGGFVAVTALFLPIFVLSTAALWAITGRLTRMQVGAAGMLILFGALGVGLNDARFLQMKPTIIYAALALILGLGLWRRTLVLKWVMEDAVPLKKRGWQILTRRLNALCLLAAAANEAVWRSQNEATWVIFEAVVMPLVILGFFAAQIPLFVTHSAWGGTRKKGKARP
ncbi:MAG: septation protein IspZ [Pseudomonadota bacterium]